jgi:hypothetical protein
MNPVVVGSIEQLLAALRARRDELEISNETIDAISGLSDRHTSKLLAANYPSRNLGPVSFPLILAALGLGVATITVSEDPEAIKRVEGRWVHWRRHPYGSPRVSLSAAAIEHAKPLVLRANCKSANEARNRILSSEDRSKIARIASKARWRKRRRPS